MVVHFVTRRGPGCLVGGSLSPFLLASCPLLRPCAANPMPPRHPLSPLPWVLGVLGLGSRVLVCRPHAPLSGPLVLVRIAIFIHMSSCNVLESAPRAMAPHSPSAPLRPPPTRPPIYWVHFHQNGGTWINALARAHHERYLAPCDPFGNYQNESCKRPMPCAAKAARASRHNATFTAVERAFWAEHEHCNGSFLYGVALTDPSTFLDRSLRHRPGMHPELLLSKLRNKSRIGRQKQHDQCWGDFPHGNHDKNVGGQYPQCALKHAEPAIGPATRFALLLC